MSTIHLDPALVPAWLRGTYTGRKFQARVVETVTIPADAGLWSGGSRESYSVAHLSSEQAASVPGQEAPWNRSSAERVVTLRPGFAVVRHSIFCGKDTGLTFYVHPSDATALLPAPAADLSELESMVLDATASLKSSYGGKDRYQMKTDDMAYSPEWRDRIPTRAAWDAAKESLIARGLLNKAGAITIAGKNARPARY